jgi:hypothetical protein
MLVCPGGNSANKGSAFLLFSFFSFAGDEQLNKEDMTIRYVIAGSILNRDTIQEFE